MGYSVTVQYKHIMCDMQSGVVGVSVTLDTGPCSVLGTLTVLPPSYLYCSVQLLWMLERLCLLQRLPALAWMSLGTCLSQMILKPNINVGMSAWSVLLFFYSPKIA